MNPLVGLFLGVIILSVVCAILILIGFHFFFKKIVMPQLKKLDFFAKM